MNRIQIDDSEYVVKFGRKDNATFCTVLVGPNGSLDRVKHVAAKAEVRRYYKDRENAVVGRTWALTKALHNLPRPIRIKINEGLNVRRRTVA